MKVLFVSRDYTNLLDGGSIVTHRNLLFLKKFASAVDELIIPKAGLRTFAMNFIFRQSYGNTRSLKNKLKQLLQNDYDFVWFDGSHYGGFLEFVKRKGLPVVCFFHNIEVDFYNSKANTTKKMLDKLFVSFIKMNETKSVNNADFRIVLNERDKTRLYEAYGKYADYILPTSFNTISDRILNQTIDSKSVPYLLFVGSNFYANREALDYIFKKIAPYIKYKIKVVGSVCNSYSSDVESIPNNVELVGRVDNLLPYYSNALAVISPILSGAGTKTKTIEAIAHGKFIIGSSEALKGIPEKYYSKIGILCECDEDYIRAVNNLGLERFNVNSYNLFKTEYSSEAIYDGFASFIDSKLLSIRK